MKKLDSKFGNKKIAQIQKQHVQIKVLQQESTDDILSRLISGSSKKGQGLLLGKKSIQQHSNFRNNSVNKMM